MTHRNPRMDPAHGDILRLRDERERHVLRTRVQSYTMRSELAVEYYDVRKSGTRNTRQCTITAWRKWASAQDVSVEQTGI